MARIAFSQSGIFVGRRISSGEFRLCGGINGLRAGRSGIHQPSESVERGGKVPRQAISLEAMPRVHARYRLGRCERGFLFLFPALMQP